MKSLYGMVATETCIVIGCELDDGHEGQHQYGAPWEISDYVGYVLSCAAAAGDEYAGWSVEQIVNDILRGDPNEAQVIERIKDMRGAP